MPRWPEFPISWPSINAINRAPIRRRSVALTEYKPLSEEWAAIRSLRGFG